MAPLSLKYKRLRDPDTTLFWEYKLLTHDHMVIVPAPDRYGVVRGTLSGWCREQFGPRGDARRGRTWNYKYLNFGFATSEMAFAFMMRWNGVKFD